MITVWKDGTYVEWSNLDAKYAENDPNWLCTIPALSNNRILDTLEKTLLVLQSQGPDIG